MPATFAHYIFAKRIYGMLEKDLRQIADARSELFCTGAQGPDLLFFYKPLSPNGVSDVGYALHEESGRLFFERAAKVILDAPADKKEAYIAYMLGFICHYSLDVSCHGYIENKIAVSKVSHFAIEKEFDKYIVRSEGKDPFAEDIACGVKKSARAAEAIAPFFNGLKQNFAPVTQKEVQKALGGFIFYNRAMQGRTGAMRGLVNAALKLSGKGEKLKDMLYLRTDNAACEDSNMRLMKLTKKAESLCLERIENFLEATEGKGGLNSLFEPTFGPAEGWQNIPVLSAQEEKNYEV